jgi:flagellar basal body P-ring formation protein FlgA
MQTRQLTRHIVLPLLASCLFFGIKLSAQAAENVTLCQSPIVVAASNVTVGDVFCQGISPQVASYVLAPTPQAGDKLVLTASDLDRVVQNFKLAWQAPTNAELVITSDQTTIKADIVTNLLVSNEFFQDVNDLDIKLNDQNPWVLPIHVKKPILKAVNIKADLPKQTITATIEAYDSNKKIAEKTVEGILQEMVTVPVFLTRVATNTTITDDMLGEQRLPKTAVAAGTVLAKNDVVGMVAKRALSPQKPILATSLTAPILIKRNDLVTIRYIKGTMQLETRARAMANGAKDEWVQLMNLSSKKLLEARVIGPQLAEIVID